MQCVCGNEHMVLELFESSFDVWPLVIKVKDQLNSDGQETLRAAEGGDAILFNIGYRANRKRNFNSQFGKARTAEARTP